tara:strand:- start:919 stop:1329 length:411 start_codon:yes stop_codon:yes gene_type:complete
MTDKTLFGPDWCYQDPNDNRIHDENGDDILDKHSLGELQKAVNSHDALVAALEQADEYIKRPDIDDDAHTLGVVADLITEALEQVNKQVCEGCTGRDDANSHRCRADLASCIDWENCPDYIGEGNCACIECARTLA